MKKLLSLFCAASTLALIACDDSASSASEVSKAVTDLKVSTDDLGKCSSKIEGSLFVVDQKINVCSDKEWNTLLCSEDSIAAKVKFSGDTLATIFCDSDSVGAISKADLAGCAIKKKKSTTSLVCDGETLASFKIAKKNSAESSSSEAKSDDKSSSSKTKSKDESSSSEAESKDESSSSNVKSSSSSATPASSSSKKNGWVIDDFNDKDLKSNLDAAWNLLTSSRDERSGLDAGKAKMSVKADADDKDNYVLAIDDISGNKWAKKYEDYNYGQSASIELSVESAVSHAFDFSSCKELSYRYKGAAHAFVMGSLEDGQVKYTTVTESSDWKTATIKISDMKLYERIGVYSGIDMTEIDGFMFHIVTTPKYDYLYIDDVTCDHEVKNVVVEQSTLIDNFDDGDAGSNVFGIWGIKFYPSSANDPENAIVKNPDWDGYVAALQNIKGEKLGDETFAYIFHIAGWHEESVDNEVLENDVFDMSSCKAITYKYKGAAHAFELIMLNDNDYDNDNYNKIVEASEDWKKAYVKISEMKQYGFSRKKVDLNLNAIKSMHWSLQEAGSLYIDEVRCVGGEVEMVNVLDQSSSSQTPSSSSSSLARDEAFSFLDKFVVWAEDGKTALIKETMDLSGKAGELFVDESVRNSIIRAIGQKGYDNVSEDVLATEKMAARVSEIFGIELTVNDNVFAKEVGGSLGGKQQLGQTVSYSIAVNSEKIAVLVK